MTSNRPTPPVYNERGGVYQQISTHKPERGGGLSLLVTTTKKQQKQEKRKEI